MNPESSTDQAAEWAARLDAGPLNRDEATALLRWLETDPANERRLEELQQLHQKVRVVLPEMARAGRLPESKPRPVLRPVWAWTGAVAASLVLAALWFVQRPVSYTTLAAQRQVIELPDGTRAELNARTTLRVRLSGKERRLQLETGEVFLTVAKDPTRPLIVETTAGSVRVTGTIFNVSHPTEDALAVVLLEGAVEATPVADGNIRRLAPGDELQVGAGRTALRRLSPGELADAVAWREGKIVFHETPLGQVLERFARHHGCLIEVTPEARNLALGGRFGLDDLDGFLKDLAVALPVIVRHDPDGRIRIERTPPEEK